MLDKELVWREIKNCNLEREIKRDEAMKGHTSWKIGGKADFFCIPYDKYRLKEVLLFAQNYQLPIYIIGNGTNIWVGDEGIRGLVVKIAHTLDKIEYSDKIIKAGAGVLLSTLVKNTVDKELAGLEFAAHIPGTLGGAIINNASFSTEAIADIVHKIILFDFKNGQFKELNKEQFLFHYRGIELGIQDFVVLAAELSLFPQEKEKILFKVKQYYRKRKESQPVNSLTAGCVFKNPKEKPAGYLIEKSGAKGLMVGDAQVSTKHANFIINRGSATANDILKLIEKIENIVEKTFGIKLEREIKFVGQLPGSGTL